MNLFDFLFPPVCPHCGAHVKQQGDWCDSCIEAVLNIRQVPSKLLSSLDSVWILADYIGGIKSMIYDVKFNEKATHRLSRWFFFSPIRRMLPAARGSACRSVICNRILTTR